MPSQNKTPQLGLNSWVDTDKPRREDFVTDNTILDTVVGGHMADTILHLTQADRQKLENGVVTGSRPGNGAEQATLTLDFEPKLFLIFCKDRPPVEYHSAGDYLTVNCGIAMPWGNTAGLSISGNQVFLQQTKTTPAAGGSFLNLNKLYGQYSYVAIR